MKQSMQITCRLGMTDSKLFTDIVNQGIDSHLEAFTASKFSQRDGRLVLDFDLVELPILVRRLEELEDNEAAQSWASDIIETPEYKEGLKRYKAAKANVSGWDKVEA